MDHRVENLKAAKTVIYQESHLSHEEVVIALFSLLVFFCEQCGLFFKGAYIGYQLKTCRHTIY